MESSSSADVLAEDAKDEIAVRGIENQWTDTQLGSVSLPLWHSNSNSRIDKENRNRGQPLVSLCCACHPRA